MKTFLAIFTCAENSKNHQAWKNLDPQTQKERMQKGTAAQQEWEAKYESAMVSKVNALGKKTNKVDASGINEIPSQMGAFILVQAESHDEAAKIFLEHPHFAVFPGDAVEVLECIDVPRG